MNEKRILNKYKKLRKKFENLDDEQFDEIYIKFKRLKMQYKLLEIAKILEKIKIPTIEIAIIRFFIKLLDFIRWKLYDLIMLLINGRQFNLFGVTIFCRTSTALAKQ